MKTLSIISQPYSDSVLAYNTDTARYELTLEFVKSNFSVSTLDDGVLQKRITKNSRKIYNVINYRSYTYNRPVIDFMLKRTEEGRNYIKDILIEQMEADLESGFNDLSSTPAISLGNGSVIDRNELYRNQISVDAEQILDNSGAYFGFNLLYQALFPSGYFLLVRENN